jgi:hypothetical protein
LTDVNVHDWKKTRDNVTAEAARECEVGLKVPGKEQENLFPRP